MRNPNGYGSVVKLSGNRRRPFWVRKTVGWNEKSHPIYLTVGYCTTREEGNVLLAEYNQNPWDVDRAKITLAKLYELWLRKKLPKLGISNQGSLKSAYNHIEKLAEMRYRDIRSYHMQECIDGCGKGYSTQAAIKNLWRHLDRFALELDVVQKMYSELLTSAPIPETSRERFTDAEIRTLWRVYAEAQAGADFEGVPVQWLDTVLILLYTGFRIGELLTMRNDHIDLQQGTFQGGIKTKAGKDRIVPIHSQIVPLVRRRLETQSEWFINIRGRKISQTAYRFYWNELMRFLHINRTPHECRHTFESLLDSSGANRRCIDLMMGHVSKDVGNRVYNHKTLEELRNAIELLRITSDE